MRICYVVPRYLPHLGGIEVHVAALAREMAALGHDVTVSTIGETSRGQSSDGVNVEVVPALFERLGAQGVSWRQAAAVADSASSYDVVHVHNIHALQTLAVLHALRKHRNVVVTPHFLGVGTTTATQAMHALYAPMARRAMRGAAQVICVTDSEAAQAREHFRLDGSRLWVVANGVDGRYRPDVTNRDPGLVLTASRLVDYKQPQAVVAALAALPEWMRVAVAGEGPARDTIETRAAAAGTTARLSMLGRLDGAALADAYRSAAVYVTMSRRECFGMTIAEALACGTPVVASDIPAHRDVFRLCGWSTRHLVDVDASPEELAAAILDAAGEAPDPGAPPRWADVAAQTETVYAAVRASVGAGDVERRVTT